ncbi:hypothetical protein GGX14DRAFT_573676 [Mycena pura]|uniref:Hydrophobin n=1 Tax=Mycena pura TaxID=153505 RepID=A0AAD6Y5S1_9AGAR|nr:hypothetical protein GGX14DRAFT_573676 [Mycena pura]
MPSFSSLVTFCIVSALLSVHGGAVQLSARQTTVPNPLSLGPFPPGSTALVTARSNAKFTQKVVVTGPPAECTFQGSGEDVAMKTSDSSTQCIFAPATTSDTLSLSLLFQFSSNGVDFKDPLIVDVSTNTTGNVVSVRAVSEDSTDNDKNDSEVTIRVTPNAPSPPPPGTTDLCCSTVGTNSNPTISALAKLLGVDISDVLGNIGVGCTVLTDLGNTCSTGNTAVNCDSNPLGDGLIDVGCVPITL